MMMLIQKFVRPLKNVEGATAIEYGLIAASISVVALVAMQAVGTALTTTFTNIAAAM